MLNNAPVAYDYSFDIPHDRATILDVRSYATYDADGDTVEIIVTGATNGEAVANPDGTVTFTPDEHYTGPASFTFKGNDGVADSDEKLISITVTNNSSPVSWNSTISVLHDHDLNQADWSDFAADSDGDALEMVFVTQPSNGDLFPNSYGSFLYLPEALFTGTVTFSFKMTDGILESNESTITLIVGNQAPSATEETYYVPKNGSIILTDLHLSGTDADGDTLYGSFDEPDFGEIVDLGDGRFQYVATEDFLGPDHVTYRLFDAEALSFDATITFIVVDEPIVANNARMEMVQESSVTITPAKLKENAFSVLGAPSLQVLSITAPITGEFTVNGNGTWTYASPAGFTGQVTIPFVLFDGVNTANAILTVFIQRPDQQVLVARNVPFDVTLEMIIRHLNNNQPLTLPRINQLIQYSPNLNAEYQAALHILRTYVYQLGEDSRRIGRYADSFDAFGPFDQITVAKIQLYVSRKNADPNELFIGATAKRLRQDARTLAEVYDDMIARFHLMARSNRLFPEPQANNFLTMTLAQRADFARQLADSVRQGYTYGDCAFLSTVISTVHKTGFDWLSSHVQWGPNVVNQRTPFRVLLHNTTTLVAPGQFTPLWQLVAIPNQAMRMMHSQATDGSLWLTVFEIADLRHRLRQQAAPGQPIPYWQMTGNLFQPVVGGETIIESLRRTTGLSGWIWDLGIHLLVGDQLATQLATVSSAIMVAGTYPSFVLPGQQTRATQLGIYASHAYAVVAYNPGTFTVQLRNPHNQPVLGGATIFMSLLDFRLLFVNLASDLVANRPPP